MQITGITDLDFSITANNIINATGDNLTAWGVNKNWFDKTVKPALQLWNDAYDNDQDTRTKNQLTTLAKNEARKNLTPILRLLINFIKGSVDVTDEQKTILGLADETHSRTPLPPTNKIVQISVELKTIRRIIGNFKSAEDESKAKPNGVSGAEIRWGITDTRPNSVDELTNSDFYSRTPFVLDFDEDDRGKTVFMVGRWMMRSSQSGYGPWGEFTSAIIP
jgi:hypothetical protein